MEDDQVLQNIRKYATDIRQEAAEQDSPMTSGSPADQAYEERLDGAIKKLREQSKQQRLALDKVKASGSRPVFDRTAEDKLAKLRQLRTVKAGLESITQSEPVLPEPGSVLPAVLALRTLQRTVAGSRDAIATTRRELASTRAQLQRERASLADAQAINGALNDRVASLRRSAVERRGQAPEDVAASLVDSRQAKKLSYERETQRLHDALVKFSTQHLGGMIAAEELGGPVAGEGVEIEDSDLTEGFGGAKKRKAQSVDDDARQKRIDEIWGDMTPVHGRDDGHDHAYENDPRSLNEREAAAREVHGLIEQLIQTLMGASSEGIHVKLGRDSAAARFLVRAKVAQYHPKDARRISLVDFGREIDD